MPMNAAGAASAMQRPRFLTPIPGSIKTGTAPILKRAKVRAKNSRLGGTMTTVRVPRPVPDRSSPRAIMSLVRSSCRNVQCV